MDTNSLAQARWRRSSACDNSSGSCLEVTFLGDAILTRDSKDPQATVQAYTRDEWTAFITGARPRTYTTCQPAGR